MIRLIIVGALAFATACNNSNSAGPPDMSTSPDLSPPPGPDMADWGAPSTMYPAMFPMPPQVVDGNGPVLTAPVFVPVFFSNDDASQVAQITAFDKGVGATDYWKGATMEYGVGPGTATDAVTLPEAPTGTIGDSDIQTLLGAKLNANDPLFANAKPTANTVYVMHYPANVTITLQSQGGSSSSCVQGGFGGYHSNFALTGGKQVAYAVIPRCSSWMGLSVMDTDTASESHELVEASTDPYPQSNAAYGQVDDAHLYWMFSLGGGETGDMCAQDRSSFTKFPGFNYEVQRSWSNAAALAGHDPCQPALAGEVYFNSAPELNDMITVGGQLTMQGVHIPVGTSGTIPIDLFSEADTGGAWNVVAEDLNALTNGTAPTMSFTWDRQSCNDSSGAPVACGQNGERLHLTINVLKSSSQYGVGVFAIVSTKAGAKHLWFGLVGEQP
jgi:hypothetical protein